MALQCESGLLHINIIIRVFILSHSLLLIPFGSLNFLCFLSISPLPHIIEPHQNINGSLVVFRVVNSDKLHLLLGAYADIVNLIKVIDKKLLDLALARIFILGLLSLSWCCLASLSSKCREIASRSLFALRNKC